MKTAKSFKNSCISNNIILCIGKEFFFIALYNFFILIGFFYPYYQLATVV